MKEFREPNGTCLKKCELRLEFKIMNDSQHVRLFGTYVMDIQGRIMYGFQSNSGAH